jgi:hypothetical protein
LLDGKEPRREGTAVQGFFTASGRMLGHARRLMAGLLARGRRSAVLGAVLLTIVSTVSVLATANTLPLFTTVTLSTSSIVNEGQTVTVTGAFTDPDVTDFHSIRIRWDTVGTPTEQIQLPPGQLSFQVSHTYTDDLAPTQITVTLYDRQTPPGTDPNDNTDNFPKDERKLPIQVRNVAPRFTRGLAVAKVAKVPGKVTIDGDLVDPGADRLTVLANFGDGTPPHPFPPLQPGDSPCTVTVRRFHCEHQYAVNPFATKTYTIRLGVADDDGGRSTFETTVQIP